MGAPRKLDENRFFSSEQKAVLFALANGCCQACSEELGKDWHADHIEPWAKGGKTLIDNGVALCAPCNLWKGGRENAPARPAINSLRLSKEPVMFAKNSIGKILRRLKETENGCLEWQGKRRPDGYGICMLNKRWVRVHRVLFEHFRGPIPEGKVLHHQCENRPCGNPWHLEPCTIAENILKQDPANFGKGERNKTHCIVGHPLAGENLYVAPNGFRVCKQCRQRRKREFNARERANAVRKPRPKKIHCPQGHLYEGDNLYVSPKGERHCRTCRQEQITVYNARQREIKHGSGH